VNVVDGMHVERKSGCGGMKIASGGEVVDDLCSGSRANGDNCRRSLGAHYDRTASASDSRSG